MKSLLILLVMIGTAYGDKFPASGPCEDIESCEAACAKNKKGTCYFGGVLVLQTAAEDRWPHAQKLFERACVKGGDGEACFQAARAVENVEWEELKKAGPKSLAAYKRACGKNHARGCFSYASVLKAAGDDKSKKLAATTEAKGNKLLVQRCLKDNMVAACGWAYYAVEGKQPKLAERVRAHQCKLSPGSGDCSQ
jgi:TPR repeat protein